jgi:hypothetical protein
MPAFSVIGVKGQTVSADGAEVKLTFASKFIGDIDLTIPADRLDDLISALNKANNALRARNSNTPQQVRVTTPKKFMVTADVDVRGIVILIFDPTTVDQCGFALDAKAAKEMAVGLVKNADAVLAQKAQKADKPN